MPQTIALIKNNRILDIFTLPPEVTDAEARFMQWALHPLIDGAFYEVRPSPIDLLNGRGFGKVRRGRVCKSEALIGHPLHLDSHARYFISSLHEVTDQARRAGHLAGYNACQAHLQARIDAAARILQGGVPGTSDPLADVKAAVKDGKKISAIKALREIRPGMGLKEVKDTVEANWAAWGGA